MTATFIKPDVLDPFIVCIENVFTPQPPKDVSPQNMRVVHYSYTTDIDTCFHRNDKNRVLTLITPKTTPYYISRVLDFLKHMEAHTRSRIQNVTIIYNQTVDESTFIGDYHTDLNNIFEPDKFTNERQLSIALTDGINPTEFLDDTSRGDVMGPFVAQRKNAVEKLKPLQCKLNKAGSATYWQTGYVHRKPAQQSGAVRAMILVQFMFAVKYEHSARLYTSICEYATYGINPKSKMTQDPVGAIEALPTKTMAIYDSPDHKKREFLALNAWHDGQNGGKPRIVINLAKYYRASFLQKLLASVSNKVVKTKEETIAALSGMFRKNSRPTGHHNRKK